MELELSNPIYLFQHLRTVNSITEIVTFGIYHNDDTIQSALKTSNYKKDMEHDKFEAIVRSERLALDINKNSQPSPPAETNTFELDLQILLHTMIDKRFFVTDSGFFGIGVNDIQKGDRVVLLFGFDTPMVVRQHGSYFTLVGGARVGGVMQGQLMEFVDNGTLVERTFEIR